nr:hypothetical protein [Tanacetum cinerariifolium]
MIPLYGDGYLTTLKFIRALAECSSSPKVTISDICPGDQDISLLNLRREVVARIICSAIFSTVASLFFWQWELSSLAVGTSPDSGNSITGSGNTLCILFPTILP